jgi:hypothetical protein
MNGLLSVGGQRSRIAGKMNAIVANPSRML